MNDDIYELEDLIEAMYFCVNQGRDDNHIIKAILTLSLEIKKLKENTRGITRNGDTLRITS